MLDIETLRSAWDSKSIQGFMRKGMAGANAHTHTSAAKAEKKATDELFEFMLEMLRIMPHAVQAFFDVGGERLWGTLGVDSLVTPPGDLALKHGILIEGEWSVVGILDAEPSLDTDDYDYGAHGQQAVLEAQSLLGSSPMSQVALHLAPAARLMLGRPSSSYGITPLLIFRTISG